MKIKRHGRLSLCFRYDRDKPAVVMLNTKLRDQQDASIPHESFRIALHDKKIQDNDLTLDEINWLLTFSNEVQNWENEVLK